MRYEIGVEVPAGRTIVGAAFGRPWAVEDVGPYAQE